MKNEKKVWAGRWVGALVMTSVLTGCMEFLPELTYVDPPDLMKVPMDVGVRATSPVRQVVEPIRMSVEVVVNETSDVAW